MGTVIQLKNQINNSYFQLKDSVENRLLLVEEKIKADAPIHTYEGKDVQKGKGRFGPYIKWNNIFINVNKKYDWDNLTSEEIEEIIEDKKQKEKEKVIHNWEEEGIRVEKGRWGKFYLMKNKKKILIDKNLDVKAMNLDEAKEIYKANSSKKSVK